MGGFAFSFMGQSNGVSKIPMTSHIGVISNIFMHYTQVYYSQVKENCETLPKLWELYMERNTGIVKVRCI